MLKSCWVTLDCLQRSSSLNVRFRLIETRCFKSQQEALNIKYCHWQTNRVWCPSLIQQEFDKRLTMLKLFFLCVWMKCFYIFLPEKSVFIKIHPDVGISVYMCSDYSLFLLLWDTVFSFFIYIYIYVSDNVWSIV